MSSPVIIQKIGGIETHYDIYSLLYKKRIVFLDEEINDPVASAIIGQLLFLDTEDSSKPIKMYINSPGGVITSGLAIIDTMEQISAKVETIAIGQACSMAAIILLSGDNRGATKNARIMLHQPSGGTYGKASEMEIAVKEIRKMKNIINELVVDKTGMTAEEVETVLENDFFLSAEEARKLKIIDYIVNKK
jgi:ATP-dependent Clp protease protease subunit